MGLLVIVKLLDGEDQLPEEHLRPVFFQHFFPLHDLLQVSGTDLQYNVMHLFVLIVPKAPDDILVAHGFPLFGEEINLIVYHLLGIPFGDFQFLEDFYCHLEGWVAGGGASALVDDAEGTFA